ncbi:ABC transporter substrate-binding protein [Paenibacillaceae bacterium WGS1546]|uniref:ABC transporter substrate-binding protein n=1 Tax=Cohnella sp. WGS1546 TaxID=3366810 RepID=UPI00372D7339
MRHNRKPILLTLLAAVMALTLAACGGKNENAAETGAASPSASSQAPSEAASEQPKEVKTLTLLMFTDWYTPGWQALEKHINDKSAELGFKLDIQKIVGGSQGEQILKTKIATNDLPDLLQNYGPKWMDQNANALDKLVDLTGLSSIAEYDEKSLDGVYKYKGKYYSMPMDATTLMGVFYNKKIFADLGLQIPTTWDEFLAVAERIKAAGTTPVYYSGKDIWTLQTVPHFGFSQDIAASGLSFPDFWEQMNTNKKHYAELTGFIDTIKKSKELIDKGYVNKSYLSDTYDSAQQAIAEGTAAMHVNGSWFVGEIIKKFPDKVDGIGAFPFPLNGDNYVNISPPGSLSVTTSAKDAELAKKAVDYIASAEAQQVYADAQPGIYLNTKVQAELAPAIADLNAALQAGKGVLHWQGNGELYPYGTFDKYMQDFYVGGKTADQVAEALDAETAKNAKAKNDPNWK